MSSGLPVCRKFGMAQPHVHLRPLLTGPPFLMMFVDVLSSLPVDQHGYCYLVTMLDNHTRYWEIQATKIGDISDMVDVTLPKDP